MLQAFDEQHAKAVGLKTSALHYGLLAIVALVIVSALGSVGLVLSIAVLIAPGVIAYLFTNQFGYMLVISALVSCASALTGVYLSFFLDSAPAPTIVLVMTLVFLFAYAFQKIRNASTQQNFS